MRLLMKRLRQSTAIVTSSRQNRKQKSMLLLSLLSLNLLFLANCATQQIPEIRPGITLPASGDGYQVDTLTGEGTRVPAEEWQKKLPRGIILFSEDWQILKMTILSNCIRGQCEKAVGALDTLFQTIDDVLKNLPSPEGL